MDKLTEIIDRAEREVGREVMLEDAEAMPDYLFYAKYERWPEDVLKN